MTTIEAPYISENFDKLYVAAKEVRLRAHAPYSKFLVGAALAMAARSSRSCGTYPPKA